MEGASVAGPRMFVGAFEAISIPERARRPQVCVNARRDSLGIYINLIK